MSSQYKQLELDHQLCFPLYACSKEIIRQYRPYLEDINLTYTQYIVMMVIWQEKTINVKELGKKLFLDSGTLTPVLKSLENKGYICRNRSLKDERVVLAELTKSGEELKEQAVSIPQKIEQCINLDKEEALQLYQILYKILNGIHDK